jgi:pyridoxal phosphate enzyme (YggS family)
MATERKESAVKTTIAIPDNLHKLREEIAQHSGKVATLIAVSKTNPLAMILEAYQAGQKDFGENKVQELWEKSQALLTSGAGAHPDLRWHFIGHLQSNKVKTLLSVPQLVAIQSVDSLKLLREILKYDGGAKPVVQVFLQVNTSGEEEKSGFHQQEEICDLIELLQQELQWSWEVKSPTEKVLVSPGKRFELAGLMTIGTMRTDDFASEAKRCFLKLAAMKESLQEQYFGWNCLLSMGMSADYPTALACGSDFIRVGQKIFGARAVP